jgi:hypothetical protein
MMTMMIMIKPPVLIVGRAGGATLESSAMTLSRGLVVARLDRSAFVRRQIRTIVTPFLLCNGR